MTQFEEWPKLLRPIARNATADGENTEPLLAQQGGREVLQVKERVKANFVPSGGFPQAVVEGDIEAQLRVRERRHKYGYALLESRLQNATLILGRLRQICANGVIELVGAEDIVVIPALEHFRHYFLNVVEVLFRL